MVIWNPKAHTQWHSTCNKFTPPSPCQAVPVTGSNKLKQMSQLGNSHSNHHNMKTSESASWSWLSFFLKLRLLWHGDHYSWPPILTHCCKQSDPSLSHQRQEILVFKTCWGQEACFGYSHKWPAEVNWNSWELWQVALEGVAILVRVLTAQFYYSSAM